MRGAPCHPQTQGKIERWHQTLKNRILLENYYLPGDLEAQIGRFVEHYNHRRYHESLQNLTPADVYFGRGQTILLQRERIKRDTIKHDDCSTSESRLTSNPNEPEPPFATQPQTVAKHLTTDNVNSLPTINPMDRCRERAPSTTSNAAELVKHDGAGTCRC